MFAVRCATKQDVKGISRLLVVAKDRTKDTLLRTIGEEGILLLSLIYQSLCLQEVSIYISLFHTWPFIYVL